MRETNIVMNGTKELKTPPFLEGEPLPRGYFETPNPYVNAPTCAVKLGALVAFARENGKNRKDLTKEDIQRFSTKS